MGRSASHIALECALQSQPNICLISEEVREKNQTLNDIVDYIVDKVVKRANKGDNFGTILVPEGLIEFIPEMDKLMSELNGLLSKSTVFNELESDEEKRQYVKGALSDTSREVYRNLPKGIARQLTLDRDPHGNVQVSLIETEKMLIEMVAKKLALLKAEGKYVGRFSPLSHFFGYEGRCAIPSNFDADYTYSLGYTASVLISEGKTGYMASVRNLTAPANEWICGGVPITMMMNIEERLKKVVNKPALIRIPVIQKALVKLNDAPFKEFASRRDEWAIMTDYVYPGPIQYFGPTEVCDKPTKTLQLEKGFKI
jgi:pyrophosphate--fructose-6-phosphate 1-phosphotransferase